MGNKRFRGRADIDLTERGGAEARKTADWIARFWEPTIVYTSPMKRCRDTGAQIAQRCGVDAEVLGDLNDIDYGDWQWQTHDAIAAESPALYRHWRISEIVGDAESLGMVSLNDSAHLRL